MLVEQRTENPCVTGSNPTGTNQINQESQRLTAGYLFYNLQQVKYFFLKETLFVFTQTWLRHFVCFDI